MSHVILDRDDYRIRVRRLISHNIKHGQSSLDLFLILSPDFYRLTMVKAVVLGAAGQYYPSLNMAPT
jgi:hypothetical protein